MSRLILQPGGSGISCSINSGIPGANSSTLVADVIGTKVAKTHFFCRELLQFDVSPIHAHATIGDATLTLFSDSMGSHAGSGYTFNAYRTTNPWTETGATWNTYDGTNNWSTAGGDYDLSNSDACTPADPTANLVFGNLAQLVADAIANRGGLLSLIVIGPESTSGGANNHEASTCRATSSAVRPQLIVNYSTPPLRRLPGACKNSWET